MIASQAGFFRQRGHAVTVSCEKLSHGSRAAFAADTLRRLAKPAQWLLPSSTKARIYRDRAAQFRSESRGAIIDHGRSIDIADIGYVHNFRTAEFADRLGGFLPQQARQIETWGSKDQRTTIIANSQMVRRGLLEMIDIPEQRVVVIYPGYDPERFSAATREKLRTTSRAELGISDEQILIGMVTSGDFGKRGLDTFLECISAIHHENLDVRALVVGGSRCPSTLKDHATFDSGIASYRPSSLDPEHYFAALDVFLYPARYEEFGIVVLEAMAMGIPIVTNTAVGASELVAMASDDGIIRAPGDEVTAYCDRLSRLLGMDAPRTLALRNALEAMAVAHSEDRHNASIRDILAGSS